ncbi:MotA/TolQ/ExbB proton channel family protein [Campylobacter majalis]|uniref:MotA/TolQ/ExbB proton channel family protein n=1 Tax=Campylobacter majalis TaxID=2790656 RepID=UPI003D698A46
MAIKSDYSDLALTKEQGDRSFCFLTYLKIIFLPALVFIFVLLGYFDVVKFKIELYSVVILAFLLFVAMFFALHSAELGYHKLLNKIDDFKTGLKDYIVSSLLEISGIKKSNSNFDEFLDNYTKDLRNENLASIGAGVFAMLGILGTFLSIALTMPSFNSSDTVGVEREIGALLNGVATAFYVSIYGIFLALWWMFFEKIGIGKFQKFAREQRALSREFFWQKDELEQRFMSVTSQHFDDIRSVFARISNEEFFKNLDNVIGTKFKSYEDLQALEQRLIGEAQIKIDQNVRLLNKAGVKQDEFVKVHTEILRATIDLNASLKETQRLFSTEYNRLNELMSDRVSDFEKSVNRFDLNLKSLDLSLKNFATKMIQEQDRSMQAFKDSLIEGVSAFKNAYTDEAPSRIDVEREIMLNDLRKNSNELDGEIERVIGNIQNTKPSNEDK